MYPEVPGTKNRISKTSVGNPWYEKNKLRKEITLQNVNPKVCALKVIHVRIHAAYILIISAAKLGKLANNLEDLD